MRAVLNREATVRLRVDDESGALVAPVSLPTLAVTDPAGATVSAGTVTEVATGVYEAVLPPQSVLTRLTAVWSVPVTGSHTRLVEETVDIVERRIVPLHRLREDPEMSELSAEAMTRLSDTVDDWFRDALRFPAVREYVRVTVRPDRPKSILYLPGIVYPKSIRSITIDGTEVDDLSTYSVVAGGIHSESGWALDSTVVIEAEHGGPQAFDGGPPASIVRAAIILARYTSRGSNYPERARQVATEGALITFSAPSPDRPTGLPEVDTAINKHRFDPVV